MQEVFQTLLAALESRRAVAYCRLVETRGSTPQKAGALMLIYAEGSQAGTLGGGCVEAEVKRQALAQLHDGRAELATFHLDNDSRLKVLIAPIPCERPHPVAEYFIALASRATAGEGFTEAVSLESPQAFLFSATGEQVASLTGEPASQEVIASLKPLAARPRAYSQPGTAYLPSLPRCRLLIVGGGQVGQAVADMAAQLEFDVWVFDDREEMVSDERFPSAQRRIAGQIARELPLLEITPSTYCLIVTRNHNHDEEALFHLAERGACYVGLIGSRRKIKLIFNDLLDKGIARESLERVYAPLGIDIGSQTVPEIAVSICAELVAHRNRGNIPGRPAKVEI